MASSRRIWIGNIPYNATEEQVKVLCEEAGPVVSFRIVTDKDTGKPKGFGFCEYRDEATAVSAVRNLQDCDLNGRRLVVNFAANDKANHQPIGLQAAVDAAAAMPGGSGGSDDLTLYLSKMSRNQLAQMVSEMKGIAVGNKEMAEEMLVAMPQLNRALLQAQIMLGMVTPQMMEKVNLMRPMFTQPQSLVTPQVMPKGPMPPHQHVPKSEPVHISEYDSALMQQVLSLPPETVASLAPELRQQVMQIQQMYRQGQNNSLSM